MLFPAVAMAAPTVTEFGGFTANRGPTTIVTGSDGNLWLTQFNGPRGSSGSRRAGR